MLSIIATLVPLALAAKLSLKHNEYGYPMLKLGQRHVCGTNFDEHAARVACYELGYPRVESWERSERSLPQFKLIDPVTFPRCELGSQLLAKCTDDPSTECDHSDGGIILECENEDPKVVEVTTQIYGFRGEWECAGYLIAPAVPLAVDIEARCEKALPPVGSLKRELPSNLLSLYEDGNQYWTFDVTYRITAYTDHAALSIARLLTMSAGKRVLNALQEGLAEERGYITDNMQLTMMFHNVEQKDVHFGSWLSLTWTPVKSNEWTTLQKVGYYAIWAIVCAIEILVLYKCVNCCIDKKIKEYDDRRFAEESAEGQTA